MRVLGVGLSKTGTTSLHRALGILGYRSVHFDDRLTDVLAGRCPRPNFRRFDDVDAACDLPTALFYDELRAAYPGLRCILTLRDEDAWWDSIRHHFNEAFPLERSEDDPFRWLVRTYAYGSAAAFEVPYRKRYREHYERVLASIPSDRLLVMRITEGDGWETLCPFLGEPVPSARFPHSNQRSPWTFRAQSRAEDEIRALIPAGRSVVLVDGRGMDRDRLADRRVLEFLAIDGNPYRPADDDAAVTQLEQLREAGAEYVVFAWPAFWWLDHYAGLHDHLRREYECALRNERVVAFRLCRRTAREVARAGVRARS